MELFRSAFWSPWVSSSLGYRVQAADELLYEDAEGRISIPGFSDNGNPVTLEILADEPSPATHQLVPERVIWRVARATHWLGWRVELNRSGSVVVVAESARLRSELNKCRWQPLSDELPGD